MESSSMLRAYQVLRKKPMLLLLLLPMLALPALGCAFIPDVSSILNLRSMADGSAMTTYQLHNIVSVIINSMLSLVSFTGYFLLIPPAMELLADGAANRETAPGWYARGLRKHWWKPIVENLIVGSILGAIILCLYLAFIFILILTLIPYNRVPGSFGSMPDAPLLGGVLPVICIVAAFAVVIYISALIIRTFFALLLPALADRDFGGAFKLLFSKKNMRQLPRLFGGLLLINMVSTLAVCTVGAVYILVTGVPEGPTGPIVAILNYFRSAPGIISLMLAAVINLLQYPFRFCVYQGIQDAEQK